MPVSVRQEQDEQRRVWLWRRFLYLRASIDPQTAEMLCDLELDSRDVLGLADAGCPPDLIVLILA